MHDFCFLHHGGLIFHRELKEPYGSAFMDVASVTRQLERCYGEDVGNVIVMARSVALHLELRVLCAFCDIKGHVVVILT